MTIPVGRLVVDDRGDGLVIRTRDGSACFDIIEIVGNLLSSLSINSFSIVEPRSYVPRITIDRLVISRETWSFPPAELGFAFSKDEATRFLAARRWLCAHNLPRFAFVKVPIERKPFYVDFDSPIYVDILSKMVRRAADQSEPDATIRLSEMLPGMDELWLPDAEGNRYASELRIVATDRLS